MDARLLDRLRDPEFYPGGADAVEVRQTHLSVVCLAGEFAYKLKKPVRFPFVDFSTPERRRCCCEAEVRLNRRLCPDIYLDVVPLIRSRDGSWWLGDRSRGEVEDWVVRMKRLPEEKMMDRLLAEDAVSAAQIRGVARTMARFHSGSSASPEVLAAGSVEKKREAVLANLAALEECPLEPGGRELLRALRVRIEADLERWRPLLEERSRRGRVVDGHGDLHARNICLTDPPVVFDCIEFRPEFRCGDVAWENAFLVMDLVYRGHPELAGVYLDTYAAESGDEEQSQLMPLCTSGRALVRGVVAGLKAADPDVPEEERAGARASLARHLLLAAASVLRGDRILLLTCGLPGTGKSHLSGALASWSGWPVVSSDRVRKELAGVPSGCRLTADYYREEFSNRTYEESIRRACDGLPQSSSIVDANFGQARWRARAGSLCRERNGRSRLLWVRASGAAVAARMKSRESFPGVESDADWSVYLKRRAQFEPPGEGEGFPVLRIDGEGKAEENAARVFTWLLRLSSSDLDPFPTGA